MQWKPSANILIIVAVAAGVCVVGAACATLLLLVGPRFIAQVGGGSIAVATIATAPPLPSDTPSPTPAPTITPIPPTPTLAPGDSRASSVDGMTQLYVPAGFFNMGGGDSAAAPEELPQRSVNIDAFWIDRTEVTNAQYEQCVNAGGCALPAQFSSNTRASYYGNSGYADYPVIYVTWSKASAYCQWAGRRLPTEAQWEKAARGADGRTYPWGETFPNHDLLHYGRPSAGDTVLADSFPAGASPYGAVNMLGNVWEWVADWYSAKYYAEAPGQNPPGPASGSQRVVRGGAYSTNEFDFLRAANRYQRSPNYSSATIGFRCVESAEP